MTMERDKEDRQYVKRHHQIKHVAALLKSGLTTRQYAEQHGLTHRSVREWRRKVKQ